MYICFSVKLHEVLCCVTLKVTQRQSRIMIRCALRASNSSFKVTWYLLQGTGGRIRIICPMGKACWSLIYDSECKCICSKPLYLCQLYLHMGTKAVEMTTTWKITTMIFIWFICTLRYWWTNYFKCKLTNNCCSIAHISSSHTIWTGRYHEFMYKPSIQPVLPYGPSTWAQHLCQSLFSCIFNSWDVHRFVVMCSEYYVRTDLGHNLTRMDRRTAISEYSNCNLYEVHLCILLQS